MSETFAQYLEKWLKQSTTQGLNNPLVKMPIKRFRPLQPLEFSSLARGGTMSLGTMSDPIARNLYRNFQTRIRERGEHCAFICFGAVEIAIAGATGQQQRIALFPVCLKRASLHTSGEHIKATVSEDEVWQLNPVLAAHVRGFGIEVQSDLGVNPQQATNWLKAQLGNRAQRVNDDSYVGLFSSQQMVVQERLREPLLRQALASNAVVKSKIGANKVEAVDLGEITDDGLEELGLVLPCDDSQLRVVQLSDKGFCLQVEGPPGTGKSQTIANIISNALNRGRNALLVCDKKAAIVQVEERLSNCGLNPAMLNLHDEDLGKREFLKQATNKFPAGQLARNYPLAELRETRKTLNDRVKFGRVTAHPSLGITKREALGGMIQLRKELKEVPNLQIDNWQALSKERLNRLLASIGQWPDLAAILTNADSVWNEVRVEAFDDNPNAANELRTSIQDIFAQLESLDTASEWLATVGIETCATSDSNVKIILALVAKILEKPACYPTLLGNSQISLAELDQLKLQRDRSEELLALEHPVPIDEVYSDDAEREAQDLLAVENAASWQDLSVRQALHRERRDQIQESQDRYLRLCDQIGVVYSPLLKVRRAQLQALLSLGNLSAAVPRGWWSSEMKPVLSVAEWKAHFQACASVASSAPFPLHFVALERVAQTHWKHVEAKAEHGFNLVSYCLHFVNDRKCKYALRQVFPSIPPRRFKQWQEVTLHAVAALRTTESLRSAADTHAILKQLTSAYLAVAHENAKAPESFLSREDVQVLERAATLVERMRARNDLFDIGSVHWQTFWEFPNPNLLSHLDQQLADFDHLVLPNPENDNVEEALGFYLESSRRIQKFLDQFERPGGNRTRLVMDAFSAQKEFLRCQKALVPLEKYLDLQIEGPREPDWVWLREVVVWRDAFEGLCGQQRLDIDSQLWSKLENVLRRHSGLMDAAYAKLETFFDYSFAGIATYENLTALLSEILGDLPRQPLWLDKKRWRNKISLFPELKTLWAKLLSGSVKPENADRLFCFNLLRLCDPVAKPHGPEFKQTLKAFTEQDERLASWAIEHLKASLRTSMQKASVSAAQSESELRRLSTLQRIRGTVRELVGAHLDYLISAKLCWMMSPTSLANLIDSNIFEDYGVPFDLVIFDEASQIRVLDGLLSMSFGKQVIIVGDKNQLPPTDFFAGFANPDGEAEDFGISESMLDEFGGVFEEGQTQVMLMSHYRSETPDLIRFSNDWFYKGELETYPPAHITGIGRRLHYVPMAVYSETAGQRNNPAEAKEVVKLIELHVSESPEKSLGVVTMNIPQMDLIDAELQITPSEKVRSFCADDSKFFLRNLETVQGDEMDRIILSLTYGKNSAGNFNASVLGPLTKSGGHRRLNVAITRQRSGLIIVSSLKVSDLESSGAQSEGFRCLKALLSDLENAEQTRTFGLGSQRFERKADGISNIVYCDSPFEEQVVEFLENEGYEIECQYGAGKFRLDIVVKERGRNLLAIECDGAGYHSSLVARTRDRARQRLLEKLGWRFHRVWSTNWWFFEGQEKDAIVEAINAARLAAA